MAERAPISPRSPRAALEPEQVPPPPKRSKGARNPLVVAGNAVFTIILLGMLAVGGGYFYAKQTLQAPGPLTEDRVVNIPKTAGTGDIAELLQREGVVDVNRWAFLGGTIVMKARSELKAGEYLFQKRASLHVVSGELGLAALDPGGLEPLGLPLRAFSERLLSENRTLKRALTDPHLFAGIGNSYSDEILHAAGMSPVSRTQSLDAAAVKRLHAAVQETLSTWKSRLAAEAPVFPEKVTAFRDDFAVHGKFGKPCPRCGTPVQRIRYADNESNYCPTCQTGGKLLADRSLSRLLKGDWPKTLEELEARKSVQSTSIGRSRSR